jgi:acetoin:2,6-dichlorophenolindophenol oxidoreductase subunit alpha
MNDSQQLSLYRSLAGSRMAETAITDLARRGIIRGHHSGLGHESIGVGVGVAMRPDDCAQMSHRSGMMLAHARGGYSLRDAVLHKFGRVPGCSSRVPGRPRILEVVGLVGTWVPMAVGVAMADRIRRKDTVTVTFFGDGASNEGAVHEAMNLAGVRQLPLVFVLENNGMAVSLSTADSTATRDLASRAEGYGMPGLRVNGQDPVAVYQTASIAISRARAGGGPSLIEARISRWEPHAVGIADLRSEQDIAAARSEDGVRLLRDTLLRTGIQSEAELSALEETLRREVDAAVEEGLTAGMSLPEQPAYTDRDAWRLSFAP